MAESSDTTRSFADALGADVVIPVTPEAVYRLRQQIVSYEDTLKKIAACDCHAADDAKVVLDRWQPSR